MLISRRKHNSEIDVLKLKLSEQKSYIETLENIANESKFAFQQLADELRNKLDVSTEFKSPGEAAYAQAADHEECSQDWSLANQDMWDDAACGAILYGKQHAAEAQIAYFKKGACVPYYVDDDGKVFTAQINPEESPGITIMVSDKFVRVIRTNSYDDAIIWFTNLVRSPPGWFFG